MPLLQEEKDPELEEESYISDVKKTKYGVPIDERYSLPATEERILRASEALKQNGFAVHLVDDLSEAKDLVEQLLPPGKEVFTAQSVTVKLTGLDDVINSPGSKFKSLRNEIGKLDRSAQFRQIVKISAAPDVIVGSVQLRRVIRLMCFTQSSEEILSKTDQRSSDRSKQT